MSVQVAIQPWTGSSDAEEGFIANWFAREGSAVKEGQVLGEVMVEKATLEVAAPQAGLVRRVLIRRGDVVKPGQVVAEIAAEGEAAAEPASSAAPVAGWSPEADATGGAAFVPASPAAKRLARELGVDLAGLTPANGERITEEDVRRVANVGAASSSSAMAAIEPTLPAETGERLAGMRKVIAERMTRSLQQAAQLTLTTEASADTLVEVSARTGAGYTALIAWALVRALQRHPALNATLEGDVLRRHAAVHLGLAVALEDGLVVPVLRDAGSLAFGELSSRMRELTEQARAGTSAPGDLSGSTFSLTTLGAYEIDAFTPILNPPEVGILGIGRMREAIVPRAGQPALGHVVALSLTFDHRAVDGAPAAAFLQTVKQLVEAPETFGEVS